jgi:Flp pilus assembly protein TadD
MLSGSCLARWISVLLCAELAACSVPREVTVSQLHEAQRLVDAGSTYLHLGQLERASAAFQVAYDLARLPAAMDGLGCVDFLRGDFEKAAKIFILAHEMDERYVNSLANLALLYEAQGHRQEAELLYRRAMEDDPKDFRARNNFAGFLIEHIGDSELSNRLARQELLKAQALADLPLIADNIRKTEHTHGGRKEENQRERD